MIVTQSPQFPTQNDSGFGDGISPILQWQEAATSLQNPVPPPLDNLHLDSEIGEILFRLRSIFHSPRRLELSNTDLHDLACFVLHRLLLWSPQSTQCDILEAAEISQCVRYAVALYMLIIHGPTYFSHALLQANATLQLRVHLESSLTSLLLSHGSLALWLLSVGMVASDDTSGRCWFTAQARIAASALDLYIWEDMSIRLEEVLWLKTEQTECLFRQRWEEVWAITAV